MSDKYPNSFIVEPFANPNTDRNTVPSMSSVDINTINSISNYQRMIELNEKQQIISVIKQDNINQIAAEFERLLRD